MFSRGHDINYLISYKLHVDRSTHRRASHKKIGKERKEENSSARLGKVGERYCPSDITRSSFFSSLFFFFLQEELRDRSKECCSIELWIVFEGFTKAERSVNIEDRLLKLFTALSRAGFRRLPDFCFRFSNLLE